MSDGTVPAWGLALFALATSLALTFLLTRGIAARIALDTPNARSLHDTPVPRTGGLALLIATAGAWWLFGVSIPATALIALAAVAAVSLLDDIREVPAAVRLVVHLGAAALVVSALATEHPLVARVIAIGLIAWAANLYNFMDGVDGLAAGQAVLGFLAYGIAAGLGGDEDLARASFAIAAAAAGFLVFNFEPARIFLGDVGSVPLGFMAGVFGLLGWSGGAWPLWFPLVVFSAFFVDSTVTLARRLLRRERVWKAHRDHYYQRLVQMGWGHRSTALAEYAVMALAAGAALLALQLAPPAQALVVAGVVLLYAFAMVAIDGAWRRFPGRNGA